jgi:hypothetical protein
MRKPILIAATALMVLTPAIRANAATTWTVCAVGCNSTTIQGAINMASNGDTIQVAAGTYPESVNVNKTLTLLGAQANNDARTRSGAPATESVVNGANPFAFNANNIVLNGFTVQGSTNTGLVAGIWTNPSTGQGHKILNNIVQNNVFGLYLNGANNVVQFNLFRNNNTTGASNGNGIYSDLGLSNTLIDNNAFSNNTNAAAVITSTPTGPTSTNLTISNNTADNSFALGKTTSSTITRNTVTNSPGSGISLFGGDVGITITCNTLQNGSIGINVSDPFGFGPNANVVAHQNNIVGNSIAGLQVVPGSHTGTLDATRNWWGSASGPIPTGTGNAVVGDASYIPFLTSPANCNGPGPGPGRGGRPERGMPRPGTGPGPGRAFLTQHNVQGNTNTAAQHNTNRAAQPQSAQ